MKGTFWSVWDGGIEIATPAELDETTGEVTTFPTDAIYGVDTLIREYFKDEDDNEYRVCTNCHEYIMTSKMFDGIGSSYDEHEVCSDPECVSRD